MTPHASASRRSRARRGLSALLLLPLLLVLSGCFRLDMGLTISEDDTVDVSMEVADLTGTATRDDMDCSSMESEIADTPEDVDFTVEDIEDDEGNVGCRIAATGAPLDTMSGDGMSIEKVDDTYVFSFDGDDAGMGDPSAMEDMPGGMEPQVSIAVTFPGEVIEADGEIDGNTVTWTGIEAFSTGGTATGEATGSGLGGGAGDVSTVVWILLGVVAVLAIAALVYLVSRKRRGGATAPDGGPAAGPAYGQPGQVPADPGPGMPAQPGHPAQPAPGYGSADQTMADPGAGYPGQEPPAAPAPYTTATTDAPVDRPEGSPFAPSPEPSAQQDPEDDQQR